MEQDMSPTIAVPKRVDVRQLTSRTILAVIRTTRGYEMTSRPHLVG